MDIDLAKLRDDLIDYYGTAFVAGNFGVALINISDINAASDNALIEMAIQLGFDLDNYYINQEKTKVKKNFF